MIAAIATFTKLRTRREFLYQAANFASFGFWSLHKGCEKIRNYMRDNGSNTTRFRHPAAKFFRACRAFEVAKLNILNITHRVYLREYSVV